MRFEYESNTPGHARKKTEKKNASSHLARGVIGVMSASQG
jgi:hypothetical protein